MYQAYLDIDDGPTLNLFRRNNVQNPELASYFHAAMDKRPAEELYDIRKDPDCLNNLAGKPEFNLILEQLSKRLVDHLKATGDPRETGANPEIWETYPRLKGENRRFPENNR